MKIIETKRIENSWKKLTRGHRSEFISVLFCSKKPFHYFCNIFTCFCHVCCSTNVFCYFCNIFCYFCNTFCFFCQLLCLLTFFCYVCNVFLNLIPRQQQQQSFFKDLWAELAVNKAYLRTLEQSSQSTKNKIQTYLV